MEIPLRLTLLLRLCGFSLRYWLAFRGQQILDLGFNGWQREALRPSPVDCIELTFDLVLIGPTVTVGDAIRSGTRNIRVTLTLLRRRNHHILSRPTSLLRRWLHTNLVSEEKPKSKNTT